MSTRISVFLSSHQLVYLCPTLKFIEVPFDFNLIFHSSSAALSVSQREFFWVGDVDVIFFVPALSLHTLLACALLQSNTIHFDFALLPKYQVVLLLALVFTACLYIIFVDQDLLSLSFPLTFCTSLSSHSVTSCSLMRKKCTFSCHFQKYYFLSQLNSNFSNTPVSISPQILVMILSLIKEFGPQDCWP